MQAFCEELVVVVYDVLEVFHFGEVDLEIPPILLYNLIAEIIDEPFDKIKHFLGQQIRLLKTSNISNLHPLQILPDTTQLPLHKLTPKQIPKQHLILTQILGIDNKIKWKLTLEVKVEIIYIF